MLIKVTYQGEKYPTEGFGSPLSDDVTSRFRSSSNIGPIAESSKAGIRGPERPQSTSVFTFTELGNRRMALPHRPLGVPE